MTMLDRMRRHRNWLKWSLALVVLTFVLFYIPDFLNPTGVGVVPTNAIAEVDGEPISLAEFTRAYNLQMDMYRNAYGGQMNETLLRQLGIDRQILQQLVDERVALAEATRLGITASDAEVRERIVRLPGFQENGQFIGEERYRQLLRFQRPPLTSVEFEASVRQSIIIGKLRTAMTGWMSISDMEVDEEYRRRNEKVKLELVTLTADTFRAGLEATDEELAKYFETRQNDFRIEEKRNIRFLALQPLQLRERIEVSPQDVEGQYNANLDLYSTPEQTRASHILIELEGRDEATARKLAEEVLAKVRAGGDFAELAKQYSEDEQNKALGGDLNYFPRGRMVPEFDSVVFSMQPGITSDLVRTQYGFHIIRVTDWRAPAQRTLDEVRNEIVEQLKAERAETMASDLAVRLAPQVQAPADLDRLATANGLMVRESGFFGLSEPITFLGPAPEVNAEAFRLNEGQVSGAIRSSQGQGVVFLAVTGRQEARTPPLDEVRDRVRDALLEEKAAAVAATKAESLAAELKTAPDFEAAVKAAGLEVQRTPDFVTRGAALPGVGLSPEADTVSFSLKPGEVSGVVKAANTSAIIKVVERQDVTPEQLTVGRTTLREELLNVRRGQFFTSYINKAKANMEITIDELTLQRMAAA